MQDPIKNELRKLQLTWMLENYEHELAEAARMNRTQHELLGRLLAGEAEARQARAIDRRLSTAKLPTMGPMNQFDWAWPTEINRDQIQHLFTFNFMTARQNVVFIATVGLGKTHIATALAREACMRNCTVLFTPAIDLINTLAAAQGPERFERTLRKYTRPDLLVIDELGYLPVDRIGAELLFQVLGRRYEKASTIITTNRAYKHWPKTFANDTMLTAAVLDRVNHHRETVIIKGKSYRMKGRVDQDD